jgi:hypothetical protein
MELENGDKERIRTEMLERDRAQTKGYRTKRSGKPTRQCVKQGDRYASIQVPAPGKVERQHDNEAEMDFDQDEMKQAEESKYDGTLE